MSMAMGRFVCGLPGPVVIRHYMSQLPALTATARVIIAGGFVAMKSCSEGRALTAAFAAAASLGKG